MKDSRLGVTVAGWNYFRSINVVLGGFFSGRDAKLNELTLTICVPRKNEARGSASDGPVGLEVAPPSVFHGHHFIEASGRLIVSGDTSNCSYQLSVLPLPCANVSSAWQTISRFRYLRD